MIADALFAVLFCNIFSCRQCFMFGVVNGSRFAVSHKLFNDFGVFDASGKFKSAFAKIAMTQTVTRITRLRVKTSHRVKQSNTIHRACCQCRPRSVCR